eukprot:UN12453
MYRENYFIIKFAGSWTDSLVVFASRYNSST